MKSTVGLAAIAFMILNGPALGQSGWTDVGSVVRLPTSTDKVGIGTASPNDPLTIKSGSADETGIALGLAPDDNDNTQGGLSVQAGGWVGLLGYNRILFLTDGGLGYSTKMIIDGSGNVGMGTTNPGSYKLAVSGKIRAKEVVVETGWSDFVFEEDYYLMPLPEVERYIAEYQHLPDVPSAEEVAANGLALGESQALLLQKVEELTLYMIDLDKENQALNRRIASLENGN